MAAGMRADERGVFIHPTADVSPQASIGRGTHVWHQVQVREGARIGEECVLGKNVYVDTGVQIGDRVKVENNASLFRGVSLADAVFIGPHACLTNDRSPRAVGLSGAPKTSADWRVESIFVAHGASVGAGAILLPGVAVGEFAIVGAGAVVTRDVPPHAVAVGNPARVVSYACVCGASRALVRSEAGSRLYCALCAP